MNTRTITGWMGAAGLAVAIAAASAPAQTPREDARKQPDAAGLPKRVRAVRKPVVDLDSMAKERRPGQVMPGDPTPAASAGMQATRATPAVKTTSTVESDGAPAPETRPITQQSLEPSAAKSQEKLPDTAPYHKPVLRPYDDRSPRPKSEEELAPSIVTEPTPTPDPRTAMASAAGSVSGGAPLSPAASAERAEATPMPREEASPRTEPRAEPRTEPRAEANPAVERSTVTATAPTNRTNPPPNVPPIPVIPTVPAPTIDGPVMTNLPAATSMTGASVRVESVSGDPAAVQWRVGGGAWSTPAPGQTAEGKVEVRMGLDSHMTLTADGTTEVRVPPLGHATIERAREPGSGSSVLVSVSRGSVEVRPIGTPGGASGLYARVKTPDQSFGLVGPVRVEFSAFTGTKRKPVNP